MTKIKLTNAIEIPVIMILKSHLEWYVAS